MSLGLQKNKKSLTRADANNLVRFFMVCYHEGACDAYKYDDDSYCEQFVADHKRELYFGVLKSDNMTFEEFQFTLLLFARNYKMPVFGKEVLMNLTKNSGIFLLCQRFYLQGVYDFARTNQYERMESFKDDIWQYWEKNEKERLTREKVLSRTQEFCVEMQTSLASDGRHNEGRRVMEVGRNLWLLTRPIGFGIKK